MQIPMVDLKGQLQAIRKEIDAELAKSLDETRFILGPNVQALEEEFAAYCGTRFAVGVASGTDALHLAIRAAGIGPGDEVITSPFTFIATAEAIAYVGAIPVFVDVDPRTYNIDVSKIEAAITPKTKAILPVHLFGQPAEMDAIKAICEKHDLLLIEDCAQSTGADYKGKMTGSFGLAGCFSFFPSKNLGCYGDGGMITTDDEALAKEIKVLRNHGSRQQYHHNCIGYNSRLDELQAVILRIKLRKLDQYNSGRRRAAEQYNQLMADLSLETPFNAAERTHVYHQYTLLAENREQIKQALADNDIASAVYYPIPLHRQDVFAEAYKDVSMPVSEQLSQTVLSLPIYPELDEQQVVRICQVIRDCCQGG
jgi:dTDP-4-amino-4,6-dideoxygalactose transaminase